MMQNRLEAGTTPNPRPDRASSRSPVDRFVYHDFANVNDPSRMLNIIGSDHDAANSRRMQLYHDAGSLPPQSMQSQKLPSKLSAMLRDPDMSTLITWMPHGRSWKVLNRDMFTSIALPKQYFGHSNFASFVIRVVNAWGFHRISTGMDRDSYYHELFLRGKPRLHLLMKRLTSCHKKSSIPKDVSCPDFYELAKTSPLPEVTLVGGGSGGASGPGVAASDTGMMMAIDH